MDKQEHTPGAIRAAEAITGGTYDPAQRLTQPRYETAYGSKTIAGIADIIDRCTAAPELLEACEEIIRTCHGEPTNDAARKAKSDAIYAAAAAIAKARGE